MGLHFFGKIIKYKIVHLRTGFVHSTNSARKTGTNYEDQISVLK